MTLREFSSPAPATCDVVPPVVTDDGWFVEVVFTPQSALSEGTLWATEPVANTSGSMRHHVSPSVYTSQILLSQGLPVSVQGARIDTRNFVAKRRHSLIYTGAGKYVAPVFDGVEFVDFQVADFDFAPGVYPRPADISRLLLGKNVDGTDYPGIRVHRVSYGRRRLSGAEARELAADIGARPARTIIAAGDSITEFSDGHHLTTNALMGVGPGAVIIGNHGRGGDTIAQLLARLDAILDQAPDDVTILIGTNDIFRNGSSWASVRTDLITIIARLKAAGIRVVLCTIPPINRAEADAWPWPGWSAPAREAQRQLANAEIAAGMGADAVVDLDEVLDPGKTGQATAGLLYDGVHPKSATSVLMGQLIHVRGYASRVYTPTVNSFTYEPETVPLEENKMIVFFVPDVIAAHKSRVVIPDAAPGVPGLVTAEQLGRNYRKLLQSASPYSVVSTDVVLGINGTIGQGFTVNLPTAASWGAARPLAVKDEAGIAAGSKITLIPAAGDAIDDAASLQTSANYQFIELYSDGIDSWYVK